MRVLMCVCCWVVQCGGTPALAAQSAEPAPLVVLATLDQRVAAPDPSEMFQYPDFVLNFRYKVVQVESGACDGTVIWVRHVIRRNEEDVPLPTPDAEGRYRLTLVPLSTRADVKGWQTLSGTDYASYSMQPPPFVAVGN